MEATRRRNRLREVRAGEGDHAAAHAAGGAVEGKGHGGVGSGWLVIDFHDIPRRDDGEGEFDTGNERD